jgi:hypothetical protein
VWEPCTSTANPTAATVPPLPPAQSPPGPLTIDDLLASAVSSEVRLAVGPCAGAAERMETLAAASAAGLLTQPVHDLLCDKVTTLAEFVRHCAWVEHTVASVVPLPVVPEQADEEDYDRERDHGRGGESKTAAAL